MIKGNKVIDMLTPSREERIYKRLTRKSLNFCKVLLYINSVFIAEKESYIEARTIKNTLDLSRTHMIETLKMLQEFGFIRIVYRGAITEVYPDDLEAIKKYSKTAYMVVTGTDGSVEEVIKGAIETEKIKETTKQK
jgi:hypothetical protein